MILEDMMEKILEMIFGKEEEPENEDIKIITNRKIDIMKELYLKYGVKLSPLNIFGIRNEDDQEKDIWNDYIGYFTNSEIKIFKGTTDPGRYWTMNPMNPNGTAHLCLGYHDDVFKIGSHKGYTALVNRWGCKKTKVWRDINKSGKFDKQNEKIYEGYFGIDLHRAHLKYVVSTIGKYSAGCQVIVDAVSFSDLIEQAGKSGMKKFGYFLFDKSQIPFFEELS